MRLQKSPTIKECYLLSISLEDSDANLNASRIQISTGDADTDLDGYIGQERDNVVFTNKRSQAKVYTVYFGISSV